MAMGWKHLGAELKTERTTASVLDLIKGMERGDAVHRAGALKFGLYNALRQKGPAKNTLARLRCTDERCLASKEPVCYDALRGDGSCSRRRPHKSRAVKCSECDYARVDHCTWCKGCRRVFE